MTKHFTIMASVAIGAVLGAVGVSQMHRVSDSLGPVEVAAVPVRSVPAPVAPTPEAQSPEIAQVAATMSGQAVADEAPIGLQAEAAPAMAPAPLALPGQMPDAAALAEPVPSVPVVAEIAPAAPSEVETGEVVLSSDIEGTVPLVPEQDERLSTRDPDNTPRRPAERPKITLQTWSVGVYR